MTTKDINKIALESLAMDLKRVALGYHQGSFKMADRFSQEVLKRKEEVELQEVRPYLRKLIISLPEILDQKDNGKKAEDLLMYSTLFQNYVLTN